MQTVSGTQIGEKAAQTTRILGMLALCCAVAALCLPATGLAQECSSGLCGTPNQSGGGGCGCGCGCGCSVLVAMTDRGDTYQFADDFDGDGIEDEYDNCAFATNYDQGDTDADGVGDACDVCVTASDPDQLDTDADRAGDACDADLDGDGIPNTGDNCVNVPNADATNTDGDTFGDACDTDDDNDGMPDVNDPCRLIAGSTLQAGCDDDADGDGIPGADDNCGSIYNPDLGSNGMQLDVDADGMGDACDTDIDGDTIPNSRDNCMTVSNPSQIDVDMDGMGDAGSWSGGAESCDTSECYVIAGDAGHCLDPNAAFNIYLSLVGDRSSGAFQTGHEITVPLFTNRLGQLHNWTARLGSVPKDSNAALKNAKRSGSTLSHSPQVATCLRQDSTGACTELSNIRFTPDEPGEYQIKVTAELPMGDAMGVTIASYTIVAEVEGEGQGGCAATGVSSGAALALAGLLAARRRRVR